MPSKKTPKKRPALPIVPIFDATPVVKPIRNHFILVADCSGSMSAHSDGAAKLFNAQLDLLQKSNDGGEQRNSVSVFEFGRRNINGYDNVQRVVLAVDPERVKRYNSAYNQYPAEGQTPLWDAIMIAGEQVDNCERATDTSVVMLILTDGQENCSKNWSVPAVTDFIKRQQNTGKWTFAFLVPPGRKNALVSLLGVPAENVQEWAKIEEAEVKTTGGTQTYLASRAQSKGLVRTSATFFKTDLSKVGSADLSRLQDVTNDVTVYTVAKEQPVKEFVEARGKQFGPGRAFYEVMKKESELQDYKALLVQDKSTGRIYSDNRTNFTVRDLLGMPRTGTIALEPGNHANYTLYAQSMSTNRKLPRGTKLAYLKK